ncbi:unnamed protein product, partial [Prorocentrum cordatum]
PQEGLVDMNLTVPANQGAGDNRARLFYSLNETHKGGPPAQRAWPALPASSAPRRNTTDWCPVEGLTRRGMARRGEERGRQRRKEAEVASADKARAGRLGTLEARRAGISH